MGERKEKDRAKNRKSEEEGTKKGGRWTTWMWPVLAREKEKEKQRKRKRKKRTKTIKKKREKDRKGQDTINEEAIRCNPCCRGEKERERRERGKERKKAMEEYSPWGMWWWWVVVVEEDYDRRMRRMPSLPGAWPNKREGVKRRLFLSLGLFCISFCLPHRARHPLPLDCSSSLYFFLSFSLSFLRDVGSISFIPCDALNHNVLSRETARNTEEQTHGYRHNRQVQDRRWT